MKTEIVCQVCDVIQWSLEDSRLTIHGVKEDRPLVTKCGNETILQSKAMNYMITRVDIRYTTAV
jgi:hypothetical protein